MKIMGVETSCDETSVGILNTEGDILSNVVFSQAKKHSLFGGIVPEVASREHVKAIAWVYQRALEESGISINDIDCLAVTEGPGLQGPLLVGISFVKGLSYGLNIPIIGVNHIEAHIYSPLLEDKSFSPPFISLIVSGGHTLLIFVKDYFQYEILGKTRDDAAGECFDKIARILNLGYPGGPAIEEKASKVGKSLIKLPIPLKGDKNLDFSFSGLKTAVYRLVKDLEKEKHSLDIGQIAYASQEAVFESIIDRLERAIEKLGVKKVSVVGGVASNLTLRSYLEKISNKKGLKLYIPSIKLCTDNGAIIANVGLLKRSRGFGIKDKEIIDAKPNLFL